ncbi:MAG TPA: type III-B CRISPR module RAMP protein Cmr6, partial [Accumulibacter sp.]|nr:type III-B CRISPR module RAMP protein Cmr6 [Accumulibacter sp.]
LANNFSALKRREAHCGLLLSKGLVSFPEGEQAGETKAGHIRAVAELAVPDFYRAAFKRWQQATVDDKRFLSFSARLAGRLYIGVVRANALETGVTISHTYGMPMIPGSAVKGLCRASAGKWLENTEARRWLFGNEPGEGAESSEIGGLVFHDAWWVPEKDLKPFAAEVVTVHHSAYYGSEGREDATDFDSPVPAAQIAVRGSFHFVVEGLPMWTQLARRLLKEGLQQDGIGAKRSSGYGHFAVGDA